MTVIHDQAGRSAFQHARRQRRAIFMILLIALLATAGWLMPGVPGSEADAPSRASEATIQFPVQHVNQAAEPAEHIQAF